jgi:superfamily I DNA and/or RNA helicase/very-short-patch-repair endonuclease
MAEEKRIISVFFVILQSLIYTVFAMDERLDKIKVQCDYLPLINFAIQQNGASIIHQLSIENTTPAPLKDIQVQITTEPTFGNAAPIAVAQIPPNESICLSSFNLTLSANYFTQLTERLSGNLKIEITSEAESVFCQTYPIDILAYDQWGGLNVLPEMLAAFITPNHTAIVPIIKRAASILGQWTDNPSLDEYQSRTPDRVRKQMAAIYTAITEQQIIYSTIPASFEEYGQRVRLADSVMAQKLGTCLDMALLYASCLEAIGLNALIIITQGHAFAGAWLVPETFPDPTIDDVSLLTKRTAEGIYDITLVETTCMNMGHSSDFDDAVKKANGKLTDGNSFILAIDVKRARHSGIRPIPQRILHGQVWEVEEKETDIQKSAVHATPQSINPYDLSGNETQTVITKQLLWERRLLDLSLRNNLLNIRITKNTLQLIPANLSCLEDALADGEEFRILHRPADWESPAMDFGIYSSIPESDPMVGFINSELSQKRLRFYLPENDLGKALTHLYRSSRTSIEENGANTLYLALGLLKWYETPSSERPRYAPILLLPVEIIRKSAAKGYVIRSREEETMMNITLLEMLRQNFGITISGLDPLPTDESGVNVKLIYSIIRNSIKNQRKWDVEEQAILGIFSFNKFIMWNDIHNNANKLVQNKIVSSLINGKIEWEAATEEIDATDMDKQVSPADIVLPIIADSSQLEAIYEAVHDKTFILHGPPGTGKSQTITNIIANALYKGKRVLFVAEKMAALSVVQNRLAAIGLAPFCLEIHSNKTKKSAVISQLKETTEIIRQTPPEEFRKEAERLLNLRAELNQYIEALHKEYPFGVSLYDAIIHYQSVDVESCFDIPQAYLDTLDKDTFAQWEDAIELLVRTANACGHPYQHPLTGISITEYSSAVKEGSSQLLTGFIDLLTTIRQKLDVFSILLKDTDIHPTRKDFQTISHIIRRILDIPELTPGLLTLPLLNETLNEYREVVVHGRKRDEQRKEIETGFIQEILSINAKQMLAEWNRVSGQWFLPRYFGQRKIRKAINVYALKTIETEDIKPLLHRIIRYQEEAEAVRKYIGQLPSLFGRPGKNEDWNTIEQIIDDMTSLHSHLLNYAKDIAKVSQIKQNLSAQLTEGIQTFRDIHAHSFNELYQLADTLTATEKKLSGMLGISIEELYTDSADWITIALSKARTWKENLDKLKDWYQWLQAYQTLHSLGIGFIATEYKEKNIPTSQLTDSFRKSFYQAAIRYIIAKEPTLELFNGKIFNDIIAKYKQISAKFEETTQRELFARLASNIPSFTHEAIQSSEVGILQKNIRNNARGISIRKLFDQIPTLLSRMCPCMLMSPLSVAQFIDTDADKFDLIVFDEASQMPTYEAVGAIARGKNVIIVGDPKQMPPTSFFSVNTIDEDNIEMEDLESILDDCLALSIPSKYLLWHYRSKHESLIAFSNSEYYDNKLMTFPSPDNIESKVRIVNINGYYDKGKSRQNRAEAQAVVDEIARRLRSEELRKKSIGVVTFNIVQQALIEDLLSDLFIFYPELETLALECDEPLFIKNLENVQGDERDVILFSVGYGPDAEGRVSMNFGPLNRAGGERRLNVAVSRARYEMIIYSTLRSDMIDLNRTSSIGVAGLKRFLEYAEKGTRSTISSVPRQLSEATASIETIIADRLRSLGYTVHTDIGCSGYKIDIGIVDTENTSNYQLGIICDGKNYKRTKTARDREIVQNNVLKALGWNIYRIWTMDWWEKPDEVMATIQEAIARKKNSEIGSMTATEINSTPTEVTAPAPTAQITNNDISFVLKASPVAPEKQAASVLSTQNRIEQKYKFAKITPYSYSPEDFFFTDSYSILLSQIRKIMESEAPISKSLLCKKILSEWGISRLGTRVEAQIETALDTLNIYRTEYEGLVFCWNDKEQCASYSIYRPVSDREATDIPPEEIANAIRQLLTDSISLPAADLIKACAQQFGFARMGSNIDAAMQRGIREAVKRNYAKIENERVTIAN